MTEVTFEEAKQIYADILDWTSRGMWKDGIVPEWAKEIASRLQVATGSLHIEVSGLRLVAAAFAKELGLNESNL